MYTEAAMLNMNSPNRITHDTNNLNVEPHQIDFDSARKDFYGETP